jgi:hypothetical protein
MWRIVGRSIIAGVVFGVLITTPVLANHTVPAPRYWWDLDDDRVVDPGDSDIGFLPAGGNWTLEKHNDVGAATGTWRNPTHWDPFDANGGGVGRATVRVDGAHPCGVFHDVDLAVTCRVATARKDGTIIDFYDISDIDIGINLAQPWNYGADMPANVYDFRGALTHELGHGARLIDTAACLNPIVTMCGSVTMAQTFQLRTIENDDFVSANTVYST